MAISNATTSLNLSVEVTADSNTVIGDALYDGAPAPFRREERGRVHTR